MLADTVVNYYHKLRVSNHRLTILLGSLFLSHTYVNEDAILFEKKQQEQNNTSHATITRPCQERGRGGGGSRVAALSMFHVAVTIAVGN